MNITELSGAVRIMLATDDAVICNFLCLSILWTIFWRKSSFHRSRTGTLNRSEMTYFRIFIISASLMCFFQWLRTRYAIRRFLFPMLISECGNFTPKFHLFITQHNSAEFSGSSLVSIVDYVDQKWWCLRTPIAWSFYPVHRRIPSGWRLLRRLCDREW